MSRCDLTDLLTDQCAHCRGHDLTAASDVPAVHHTIAAQYPGRCAADPDHSIDEGDLIGRTDDGWVCPACVRVSRGGRS